MLEASAAAEAVPAGSASGDCVSSAVAGLPFAERLTTDSLINAGSSSSLAPLDLAQVLLPCPSYCRVDSAATFPVVRDTRISILQDALWPFQRPSATMTTVADKSFAEVLWRGVWFPSDQMHGSLKLLCMCSWRNA